MRWVAVAGQALTVFFAATILKLDLPIVPLVSVMAVTFLSNVGLFAWYRRAASGTVTLPRVLPGVLIVDTLLFTAMLGLSGGPWNPFASLYVVHVALAAVALSRAWTWYTVAFSGLCYAILFSFHVPLRFPGGTFPDPIREAGLGISVLLVAAVIAYFMSNIAHALRAREADLAKAQEQAGKNEWLASLAALAAGTAHELGTPLGTIAVVSKELERAAARLDDQALLEDAQLVRSEVDRCRRILDRISALDREGLGPSPEPVDLERLLETLHQDQGEGRSFTVDVAPGLPRTGEAVPPDVAHALQPLLANALDATRDQGVVTLRVEHQNGDWAFRVSDDGPGMTRDVQVQALEPFFTTKEYGRGMGLGLYLSRLIAERHGGSLELDSREGAGTTATLMLPRREPRTDA